eukprot:gene4728-biopygen4665
MPGRDYNLQLKPCYAAAGTVLAVIKGDKAGPPGFETSLLVEGAEELALSLSRSICRRRTAYSFDLKDGYHMNRIHPAFQSYTQFDLWGHLMRCSALPLRWNDSPRILVKVMWALAEAIRAPQALRDRTELRKRRGGAGGTGSCKAQALRVRETLTNTLHRLGMERNEKKGVWEPTPLVEHLGLEVGTKDGQFKVDLSADWKSPVRPRHLLSTASRERPWWSARELARFNGLCRSVYLAVPPT